MQVNQQYFLLALFYRNDVFRILGVCLTENLHNIDGRERLHNTTLNIHITLKECIREFKFGVMIHQALHQLIRLLNDVL